MDKSQTTETNAEPKLPPLADKALLIFNAQGTMTANQFDELALLVNKALALSDVLNAAVNGSGDAESLHEDTLATYLCMLYEVLHDARGVIDGTIDARIASKEVAHG
jgi:hypothetical protein